MLKPNHIVFAARGVLLIGALGAATLMLGPFQGLERNLGLNDKAAHALAFGILTAVAFLACPRMRRADLALAALVLGGGVEVAQMFGNRSASLLDWLADGAGIGTVYGVSLIEGLRKMAREHGDLSLQAIASLDRRRSRRRSKDLVTRPRPSLGTGEEVFAKRAARKYPARRPA
jgi:hypothetical protein